MSIIAYNEQILLQVGYIMTSRSELPPGFVLDWKLRTKKPGSIRRAETAAQ